MRTYLLSHLLDAQAARQPNRIALEVDGQAISYGRLAELSDRLAAGLLATGIGYRDRIGIYLPKGQAAYLSIFATLKLGAAYVPLDPEAPATRIAFMVENCSLRAVITTAELAEGLLNTAPAIPALVLIDGGGRDRIGGDGSPEILHLEQLFAAQTPPPENLAIENDLAYVLYTSGSTGNPKGVMVSHRGALAFAEWAVDALDLGEDDRVAAVASLHFDLSVFDLFATIAAGAALIPLPQRGLLRPQQLTEWIATESISVWYSTPSTLILLLEDGQLANRDYPDLKHILFAGEVFPTKHLRQLHETVPGAKLYNLYGPTETNVCTWKQVEEIPTEDSETVSIGRACANTEVKALVADGSEAKVGEEGELWVRGPTVMRGYWDDEEKTRAAFQQFPEPGGSDAWYATGDLVSRDMRGEYHFHGRRDHMVKIRGYRVEIGEVEATLYSHPNVREVAVVAVSANGCGKRLQACVVPHDMTQYSAIQLKAYLGARLPAYMIPSEIRCLESLPKTSTEKVDRQALALVAQPREALV